MQNLQHPPDHSQPLLGTFPGFNQQQQPSVMVILISKKHLVTKISGTAFYSLQDHSTRTGFRTLIHRAHTQLSQLECLKWL